MPVFEYKAVDPEGKAVSGTMLSPSLGAAADDLAKRGFTVESLGSASVGDPLYDSHAGRASSESSAGPQYGPRSRVMTDVVTPLINPVGLQHVLFFFRQLATMLNAGVGMVQSLDTLASQTSEPRLRAAIKDMREHALAGNHISVGMQRYPEIFNPLTMSLVRVGERGGMLEQSCRQIADYTEREIALKNMMKRVTLYPKIVLATSIIVILGANMIIAALGKQGGLSSPLTNPATWLFLGPLIFLYFLFTRVGLRNPRVQYDFQQILLKIPGLGKTTREFAMARFGRAFGALYAGGVAPQEAIRLAADACGNEYMRAQIYPVSTDIENGGGLAEAFVKTGVFSPIVIDMISTGERTGNVDAMLHKMAEFYEDEAQTRSYQFGMIFGVVIFLCVAIYVAYVVISFYTGYFTGITQAGQ